MDVAISGDRSSCLTQQLAPETYLFAVAHGFGRIDGEPIASAVLSRLRGQLERKARGDRFRRSANRPKAIVNYVAGAFNRINGQVHARSSSHEDYITAVCSLTGVLLVNERAYLAHAGSTAAYLARDGCVVSLTKSDAFESEGLPVLTRAVGAASTLEITTCSFALSDGDALILSGRRLQEAEERRRLSHALSAGTLDVDDGEQLLVVHYEHDAPPQAPEPPGSHMAAGLVKGILATILFYTLLCLR